MRFPAGTRWLGGQAGAVVLAAILFVPAPAWALTLEEIVQLSRAGVADEVLEALIEVDGSTWTLDPDEIIDLIEAGVSQRVIRALVVSGRGALGSGALAEDPWPDEGPHHEPKPQVEAPAWTGGDVPGDDPFEWSPAESYDPAYSDMIDPAMDDAYPYYASADQADNVTIVPATEPPPEPPYSAGPSGMGGIDPHAIIVPVPVAVPIPVAVPDVVDDRRHARGRGDGRRGDDRDRDRRRGRDDDREPEPEPPARQSRWARDLHRASDDGDATTRGPARRARDLNAAKRDRDP